MAKRNYTDLTKAEVTQLLEARDRRDATRFGLVWEANEIERDRALNQDFVALDLDQSLSCGNAPWKNLILEGDNFDALRYLRMTFAGRVKCIYIDPPYNTGNRDFVYNDRYVDKEDLWRHSKWCEFMFQRLTLAKDLLRQDGVIFVPIDDNEFATLRLMMDRVFGEINFVGTCIWQKRYSVSNDHKTIAPLHNYVVVFQRSEGWERQLVPRGEEKDRQYTLKDARGNEVLMQSPDDGNQLQFLPEPPVGAHFQPPPAAILNAQGEVDVEQLPLFVGAFGGAELSRTIRSVIGTKPIVQKKHTYSLRENVPHVFKTEVMQDDEEVNEDEVAANFIVNLKTLRDSLLANSPVTVQKKTVEIFTQQIQIEIDYAPPSMEEKALAAQRTLFKFKTLNAKVLRAALTRAVFDLMVKESVADATELAARNALDDILCFHPYLLREAYQRAIAAKALLSLQKICRHRLSRSRRLSLPD